MDTSKTKNPSSKEITAFFLILAGVFGLAVRIYPLLNTRFPLVDGGMFLVMIGDLQAHHFTLPAFTTYNHAQIPFAYPPLAFYLTGFVNSITGLPLADILKWQPLLVNTLSLPIFYLFARRVLRSDGKAALAALIFALTPNSYWWQIVGGGLTRSLGAFFFLLAAYCAEGMYRTQRPSAVLATTLCSALAVLSHPEWGLQTAGMLVLFCCFWGRDRKGILLTSLVGTGILLLSMPWWLSVVLQHGLGVFQQASQATEPRWLFWTIPFALSFTGEITPVIAVFALCGLFIHLGRRDFLLPVWALLILVLDPRGGLPASSVPFTIMAATTLADGIAPHLASKEGMEPPALASSLRSFAGRFFWGTFLLLFLYGAFRVSSKLSQQTIDAEEIHVMRWIQTYTDPDATFLILDWQANPFLSPLLEWFPAATGRTSLTTVQGSEWLSGEAGFDHRLELHTKAQQCLFQEEDCLRSLPMEYDYILISLKNPEGGRQSSPLLASLGKSQEHSLVYSSHVNIYVYKLDKSP